MNQNNPDGDSNGFRTFCIVVGFIGRSIAAVPESFLHTRFGGRYLNMQAAAGLLILLFWMIGWPGHSATPMTVLFWLYVAMCLRARIETVRMARTGEPEHSFYSGLPRLCRRFPRLSELTVKGMIEPALVCGVGLALFPLSEPLASYLLVSGFALGVKVNAAIAYDKARADRAVDSILEARAHAVRVRVTLGERV